MQATANHVSRPKRVAPTSRSCTFVVPKVHYQHAARLALERSGAYEITYADLFREAIAQWIERNPLGSPASSSSSAPALPPTPIEKLASGEHFVEGVYVHALAFVAEGAQGGRTICGLVGVARHMGTTQPDNVTCPKCRAIHEGNASALARASSTSTTSRTSTKRSTSKRGAKKKAGRR